MIVNYNMKVKFTSEQKYLLALGIVIAAVVVIGAGIIYPTVNYIGHINDDTYQLRAFLEKKYQNVMKLKNSKEQINQIKDGALLYQKYLFTTDDTLKLITVLENLAEAHSVTQNIENTNLDKIENNELKLSITATGNYRDLFYYLKDLENAPYFLNPIAFSISSARGRDPNSPAQAVMHLTLHLYVNQ